MPDFKLVSEFKATGDQPQAIDKFVAGLEVVQREQKQNGQAETEQQGTA